MKRLVIAITVLLSAACGAQKWSKPNSTETEFRRDDYECERENQTATAMVPLGGVLWAVPDVDRAMFRKCMEARGWRRE